MRDANPVRLTFIPHGVQYPVTGLPQPVIFCIIALRSAGFETYPAPEFYGSYSQPTFAYQVGKR